MELMLNHVDSPYIRCIGFLYLRYACDPKEIWDWFMPYLYDEEPVKIAQRSGQETVGDFVRMLLDDLNYYGTRLPRFPLTTEREMKVKLLQEEQIEARAVSNEGDKRKMDYFQKVGSRVRALYGDEENPVTWYDGVIDRVIWRDDETGTQFTRPKFIVTFPEYGNTETVSLGEMDMPGGSGEMKSYNGRDSKPSHKYGEDRHLDRGRDRRDHRNENGNYRNHAHHRRDDNRRGNFSHRDYDHRGSRNRDRSRSRDRSSPSNSDLMEEVKRREREKVFAKGRAYASRPATFKQSLSVESGVNVSSRDDHSYKRDSYRESAAVQKKPQKQDIANSEPPSKQKTEEELAAVKDKKRKLMAKYG
jgi:pre-mRNA-splicing factor 38B